VTPVYNGQECLRVLEERGIENGFDLIFMDLEMPVMNGEQAVRQIRKMEQAGESEQWFWTAWKECSLFFHLMLIGCSLIVYLTVGGR
jgi:CheY-like chemotaxis protein